MIIDGGSPLRGSVKVSGSKNECLALLAAGLLGTYTRIRNVPRVTDVFNQISCLKAMGCKVRFDENGAIILEPALRLNGMPSERVASSYRGSILLLPASVVKYGYAKLPIPGGCEIGERPIQVHLKLLERLGANVVVAGRSVVVVAKNGLKGARLSIRGEYGTSVTATCSALIAAAGADGTSKICDCAIEPEVSALAMMLRKMGVEIFGIGSREVTVVGRKDFETVDVTVSTDRIEFGTWLLFGALLGDELSIVDPESLQSDAVVRYLRNSGATIRCNGSTLTISRVKGGRFSPVNLAPFPELPTDLHPFFAVLLSTSKKKTVLNDAVFPNRLTKVRGEMSKLRACSVRESSGFESVRATDTRAAAALVMAALARRGSSQVFGLSHLDRAYENFESKLVAAGAKAKRVNQ